MKTKIQCIVIAFILGPFLVYLGIQQIQTAKRLNAEGKPATAKVVDGGIKVSFKRTQYYLTVEFSTEDQQTVIKELKVSYDQFQTGRDSRRLPVRYLPAEPETCAVGEQAEAEYLMLVVGVLVIGGGIFLIVMIRMPTSTEEAAEGMAKAAMSLTVKAHEYATVRSADFGHLDLAWYDRSQQALEACGFKYLEDVENLTVSRSSGMRTLLRTFVSRDGAAMAGLYHIKPGWLIRVLGAKPMLVVSVDTQFTNGEWVCISNAEKLAALDQPTSINALHLPAATPLTAVVEAHWKRVAAYLEQHPGVAAVRVNSAEECRSAQAAQQAIKAAFRAGRGLGRDELQRLAGGSSPALDETRRQANQMIQNPNKPPA